MEIVRGENMSNWSQQDANALLTEFAKLADKVLEAKMGNVVRTVPATVKAVSGTTITVLPVGFTDTPSQYLTVKNYTSNAISENDTVWINYWGDYTNAYLSPASFS